MQILVSSQSWSWKLKANCNFFSIYLWYEENRPLWKLPPCENCPPEFFYRENFSLGKLSPMKSLPAYTSYKWKKKQHYKNFCLEESCAIQHPYENNQRPLWYTDDFTENSALGYFLYRVKKIKKSNESPSGIYLQVVQVKKNWN